MSRSTPSACSLAIMLPAETAEDVDATAIEGDVFGAVVGVDWRQWFFVSFGGGHGPWCCVEADSYESVDDDAGISSSPGYA
jgi:hypothetical protein